MLITVVGFIIVLGFLVLVHELGHFLVARLHRIAVREFGIGFPPKLFARKVRGTVYSINAVPLGGFVKIKGEDDVAAAGDEDSFASKSRLARASVIVSGVAANVIAGWLLLVILFMAGAPVRFNKDIDPAYVHNPRLSVSQVLSDSPAENAGLAVGDILLAVDGRPLTDISGFQEYTAGKNGQPISLRYERSGREMRTELTPRVLDEIGIGRSGIGVGLIQEGIVRFPPHKALAAGTVATATYLGRIATAFWSIVSGLWQGEGVGESLGGPVAIAVATGDALDLGLSHLVIFTAILSFNLAIINILPFPALDGGRLIFLAVEALRKKPSRQELEAWFHRVGFALLMLLAVAITYRDLVRFGGRIWKAVLG